MISIKPISLVILVCLMFPVGSVYGHGLGIDTISSIDIQGKKISISVEAPTYLENDHEQITITATEDKTQENVKNITLLIGMIYDGETVFRESFFIENGVLPIKVSPQLGSDFVINGNQDSGVWYGADSIEIVGPLFTSGGLYTFEIQVQAVGESYIENPEMHRADLSIADTSIFTQKDAENNDVEFSLKSYFDKISSLEYDSDARQVTFEMPFDWGERQVSHVPVVHVEVHFPKGFAELLSPGYVGYANGIELFKSSVTIDDYTEEDERIVHFVLLQDHLKFLKNEMRKNDVPLPENITFVLSASDVVDFPLSAYTKSEDFEVNLSWDPVEIEPGVDTNFVFTIRDGATGAPLRSSDYTFVIIQNGMEIHRVSGTAQVGGDFEKFTFADDQTGPVIVKFENIRGTGQETEFGIVVAPEFGAVAVMILGIALVTVIYLGTKYGTKFPQR